MKQRFGSPQRVRFHLSHMVHDDVAGNEILSLLRASGLSQR